MNAELIKHVREWLDEEMQRGKTAEQKDCIHCGKQLHVFKADWAERQLWTCYNCGSSGLF